MPRTIPLSSPDIDQTDIDAVTAVLRTPSLSLGPKLPEFEQLIADYAGTKHAIAVNSGTSALHLCMRALDIQDGDEVITSPFSFIASSNCILFERAVPVFADILGDTLCIDPALVEKAVTKKTKAILGVDVFGKLCDWEALKSIADKHGLALIEDSCEALGSSKGKTKAGAFADCGTFAFYPNKQMTTGEGGMIVTDRDDIAAAARSMRNQGRAEGAQWLAHERLGYNYRLSDINCALGISQLRKLEKGLAARARVASWYADEFAQMGDRIRLPGDQPGVNVSWFVYVVRLTEKYGRTERDRILEKLRAQGIGCNNYFPPIHLQPFYRRILRTKEGMYPVTESVAERTIALPFHNRLSQDDVRTVAEALRSALPSP